MDTHLGFGMLAPEVIAAQLLSGPGSAPMRAAAAAWETVAAELQAAATGYESAIAALTEAWHGPSAADMAAATTRYAAWLSITATQAAETAGRVSAAASAYEAAVAAVVAPPVIAANRRRLAVMLATNIFGRNAAAIAAIEAEYAQMWVRNTTTMHCYAASAAAATRTTPFTEPPQHRGKAPAASGLSFIPQLLDALTSARPLGELTGSMAASALYEEAFAAVAAVSKLSTLGNAGMSLPNIGMVQFKTFFKPTAVTLDVPVSSLGAGLRTAPPAVAGGLVRAASVSTGDADLVGRLSVPPSWATTALPGLTTPAIRLAAAAPPDDARTAAQVARDLAPAAALGGLAGGALGRPISGAPRIINAGSARGRATVASPAGAPVRLDRVIAQLQQKPDSVRHWSVDQAGLDGLIAELSSKPGIHAVHLVGPKSG